MAATNLPRRIAWEVLLDVATKDSYANLLLPVKLSRTRMSPQDAAFTTELAYGTLRQLEFYDAIIAKAAKRSIDTIDPEPLAALRLGTHQILAMRVPDHAALSETVDVVKHQAPKAAGFTNAVLRRVSEADRQTWLDRATRGLPETQAQSIEYSHPEWIVRALTQALKGHGRAASEILDLLRADNAAAKVSLSALPGLLERAELPGTPTPLSPIGMSLDSGIPGDIPQIGRGLARVQDEGSALVALALAQVEAPEGRWADLCAGPGGKAAVLGAAAASSSAELDAFDSSEHRVELVKNSTQALHNVRTSLRDAREVTGPYSRVLVDVPCSGLGALRRRPEARYRRQPADINALGGLQRDILSAALDATAPGGVVAYSTCSPHYAETVLVVDDVLRKTSAEVLDAPAELHQLSNHDADSFASVERGTGRYAQLWTHVHNTDGMFLALLRKAN